MLTNDTYPKTLKLKDGRTVTLRPLQRHDADKLGTFFSALPDEDRMFLRHDVSDPDLVRQWTEKLDFGHIVPLVALDGDTIVGDGTLHIDAHEWMQHVAQIRLVTARTHRHKGLGALIARELVALAADRDIEKLQAHVTEDNLGAIKMFQAVGFNTVAVLKDMVKDQTGRKRNLAIMDNDVASLGRIMEDWIHDSMLAAYRVPGGGA